MTQAMRDANQLCNFTSMVQGVFPHLDAQDNLSFKSLERLQIDHLDIPIVRPDCKSHARDLVSGSGAGYGNRIGCKRCT